MIGKMNRRDFALAGTAAGLAAASGRARRAGRGPDRTYAEDRQAGRGGFGEWERLQERGEETCVEKAFRMITGGGDVLDALIAGVNILELDPEEDSVGFGGLPNADGVVQLDACCMHGPRKRAGGVAALEGVRTPSLVANAVMENTDHHLLVGEDAQRFARSMGFKIEDDLNTEKSRKLWLEWKRRVDPEHYLDPAGRAEAGHKAGLQMVRDGLIDPDHYWGTINCNGIGPKGELCGVTTTSGLAWKIPGRVGDSPILARGCTSTATSGPPARPVAARRISIT